MVNNITDNDFDKVLKDNKKVLVDFYATWCGPCKMLSPIIDSLAEERNDIKFYKMDVDNNSDIPEKFNIMSIPTIILFENGEISKTNTGLLSKDELINFIEN